MSKFISNIGEEVSKIEAVLLERENVGRSRPVIRHILKTVSGDLLTIFTTRKFLLDIKLGSSLELSGMVKAHNEIEGKCYTVLNDFFIHRVLNKDNE